MESSNRVNWWLVGIVGAVVVILLSCVVAVLAGGLIAWAVAERGDDARGCTMGRGTMQCPCGQMQGGMGGGMMGGQGECCEEMQGGMMAPEMATPVPFGGGQMMTGGALVLSVVPGSPAADAGLMAGDTIVAVDGQRVGADVDLADVVARYSPGDVVMIQYQRGSSVQTTRVMLGQADNDSSQPRLGIEYRTMPMIGGSGD